MSAHLFAYGTLQHGLAPGEIAAVVEKLRTVGPGFIAGTLYDLGEYPGAVLDPGSARKIHGTIFELPEDADLLRQLDVYEGFNPENSDQSLFVRTMQRVTLTTGGELSCWVYAYNRSPAGARIVESGIYTKKRDAF
jgi:gamma-glutamylcyclotransferase (GGCT)/AIG2-like uncharacterized protein YtfP